MTRRADPVRKWLVSLGVLTVISVTRHEAEMKLCAYAPMLLREFPRDAFTADSLAFIARQCDKGFPTYPELSAHLSRWWRDNRPFVALPAPPPTPPRPPPTEEELALVAQSAREATAYLRGLAPPPEPSSTPGPRHLSPDQLDAISPLPDGRKRAPRTAPRSDHARSG